MITFVELREDVRFVDRGIKALVSVFKRQIFLINLITVRCLSLALELDKCLCFRLNLRHGMLRIGLPDWQEIVGIDDHASLLHDAVRALSTRLVDIPYHFLVDTLQRKIFGYSRTKYKESHLLRGWQHQHWHAPKR